MLFTALRQGAAAVRRAGWPAYAVAVVAGLPDLVPFGEDAAPVQLALFPVVGLLRTVLFLGLIRVLAANRHEPVSLPPEVDASGVRVVSLSVVPPVGDADRRIGFALRQAALLGRPALRLFALSVLGTFTAIAIWWGIASASGIDVEEVRSGDLAVVVPLALLTALLLAFIAVADQRVAIEGDPRVLLAAAHSVRIAGVAFGAVYLLVLIAVAPGAVGELLPRGGDGVPWHAARILVSAGIQLVVLGALNEVYLAGPRADLLVDTSRPSA